MVELLITLKYYLTKLLVINSFNTFFITLLAAFIAFFAPIAPLAHCFILLIFTDLITGILASRKRNEPIISRKLSRSIYKVLLYSLFLLALYSVEIVLFGGIVPITKIGFGLVLLTEFKSLTENLDTIFEVKTFKSIYNIIKNLFRNLNKNKE